MLLNRQKIKCMNTITTSSLPVCHPVVAIRWVLYMLLLLLLEKIGFALQHERGRRCRVGSFYDEERDCGRVFCED